MKILITGGSGFLGSYLTKALEDREYEVAWLSQSQKSQKTFLWNVVAQSLDKEAIEWADIIIHLAGASIAGKRWTKEYKQELVASRILGTRLLHKSIAASENKPKQLIASSATGFYGAYEDDHVSFIEENEAGKDFLAELTKNWEKEIFSGKEIVNTSALRIGIVLGNDGGALDEMVKPAKLGVSAPLGSGNQVLSWIHIDDLVQMFLFLIDKKLSGVFNAVSPEPISNKVLTKAIAKSLSKPCFLPNVPGFVLKILLGEFAEFVLLGARVSSKKMQEHGFVFKYENHESALQNLIQKE